MKSTSIGYYSYGTGMSPDEFPFTEAQNFHTNSLDTSSLDSNSLQSIFQTTVQAPLLSQNTKMANSISPNKDKMAIQIQATLDQLQGVQENIQEVQNKIDSFSSNVAVHSAVQVWVADTVLKGGASAVQSGVPFIMNFLMESSQSLEALKPATESIKAVTDIFDSWGGLIGFIYQTRLLQTALKEVYELKKEWDKLTPEQQFRLSQLEGRIKYEESLLSSIEAEQLLRSSRNLFSYATFALSWLSNTSLVAGLTSLANAMIGGFNAAIQGVFFYRARENLKKERSWAEDFKIWAKEKLEVTDELLKNKFEIEQVNQTVESPIDLYLKKKAENREGQIAELKSKLERGELSITSIQDRLIAFESEGLQRALARLKIKDLSDDALTDRLKEMLSIAIDVTPAFIQAIRSFDRRLEEVGFSTLLAPEEAKAQVEKIKGALSETIKNNITSWMEHQSVDSLLHLYVDYHSIVDLTVKNSLAEIVQKQHKINEYFLKFKKKMAGGKFTVATAAFGIAFALAIIGLAATPVGQASLILLIVTVASAIITVGLTGAGYYNAYKQRPLHTRATLNGTYVRLYSYYAAAKFHAIKESIENYMTNALRDKSAQLSALIGRFRLYFRSPAQGTNQSNQSAVIKVENEFQKAKSKAQEWSEKAERLEEDLNKMVWADFAKRAQLKIAKQNAQSPLDSFDTLEAFNDALIHGDLEMLSPETKELLEQQLGINIYALQLEIAKDPLAVKKILQKFFTLEDVDFVKFIGKQRHLEPKIQIKAN